MDWKPECWDECCIMENCRKCHKCIADYEALQQEVLVSCAAEEEQDNNLTEANSG